MKNTDPKPLSGEVLFKSGIRATVTGHSPSGAFASEPIVWVLPHGEQPGNEQACLLPAARNARARFLRASRNR